ncbi:MAG TPA: malectin domain-containing carbohydrate-binding protein [Candidatus Sulfopaludibacter sp.]|nr:malectin domain-containing carbohydrate-binding protein [Candidatus Sulfopaludibacter sp.]
MCARYFEGAGEQIKEYNIAVEALGRPAEFDQKRDSIVRVEAHRLRKRLRDYYEAEGAGHPVRIEIPSGQYAPQFLRQTPLRASLSEEAVVLSGELALVDSAQTRIAAPAAQPEIQTVVPLLHPAPPSQSPPLTLAPERPDRDGIWVAIALAALCMVGAFLWKPTAKAEKPGVVSAGAIPGSVQEVRILTGLQNGTYTDRFGRTWESDRYFEGGETFDAPGHTIVAARDPRLFRTRREGTFSYDIPLQPGIYEMRLYFAETLYGENNVAGGGETSRIFSVSANGAPVLSSFDVIGEVGDSTADIRAFKGLSPAADGKLHLKFEPQTNPAIVSAIEITPGVAGKLLPVRVASRDHPYTDKQGRVWAADDFSSGGQLVMRPKPVANMEDPELLRGERYGNLTYVIPVPPGRYGLNLYFTEAWFGPGNFAGGGIGSRIFDILCNGVALRRSFDIFREAGGNGRGLILPLHGIEPNAQGKIVLNLLPVHNYAELNALEVVDESR